MSLRIVHTDGTVNTIPTIRTKESREFNKQWTLYATVDRADVNAANLEEGLDEVYLEINSTDEFGGVLRDVERTGTATVRLIVDSFERLAREAEPTGTNTFFDSVDDTVIINDAISRVPGLTAGTIQNVKSGLVLTYSSVSPARMIRTVRDITKAKIRYNPDKTIDYISSLGSDKTGTTLSPSQENVEDFKLKQVSGEQFVNHMRVLGGGSGDAQTVIDVTASQYSSGEREIWMTYANRDISNSNTLREHGQELVDEMYNPNVEASMSVRDVIPLLGDQFHLTYTEEDIDRDITVVKADTIRDKTGTHYEIEVSNRELARYLRQEKVAQDVQRFNRSGAGQVVSTYDDPTLAPDEEGNLIYVTGQNTSYERGVYYHNASGYEGTQYPDVDAHHGYFSDSFVVPVGTDMSGLMVLPTGVDKYDTT